MNPYEILGVPSNADDKQIKAAYRQRSKETHPDKVKTGEISINQFRAVQLSYEILKDPVRRRRYDTTGRLDSSPVTPERIIGFIKATMHQVVEAARKDGSTDDPTRDNVRDGILMALLNSRSEVKNLRHHTYRKMERTQRLLERFKPNKGDDPVGDALRSERKRLQEEMDGHDDALELSVEVERIFRTYGYEVGPGPEGHSPGPTARRNGPLRLSSWS